jgi:hypothetical protein
VRLLRASLLKLWRRPATRRTFLVVAGILALIYLSIAGSIQQLPAEQRVGIESILVFPAAYTGLGTFIVSFGSIAAAALAGLTAGAEWAWGTFRVATARGESRARYVLATFAALAILLGLGTLVLYVIGVALTVVGDQLGGLNPGDLTDPAVARVPAIVLGAATAVVTAASIGYALSFVLRNQIAGIVGVVALSIGEQLLGIVVPDDLERYGPTTSGTLLVTAAGGAGFSGDWLVLFGVNLAYIALALAATAAFARRADVP